MNPAPARETIPTELLEKTDIIIPNETETEIITGIRVTDHNSLVAAAEKLHELGIGTVIITLGSAGAFYHTEKNTVSSLLLKWMPLTQQPQVIHLLAH